MEEDNERPNVVFRRRLTYTKFPSGAPVLQKGDGDGTVNLRSLLACTQWEKRQSQPFRHHVFPNVDHLQILRDDAIAEYVEGIVESLVKEGVPGPGGSNAVDDREEPVPNIEIIH